MNVNSNISSFQMLRRQSLHEPFIPCFVKFLYQNWNLLQEPDGLVARSLSKIQEKLFFGFLSFPVLLHWKYRGS